MTNVVHQRESLGQIRIQAQSRRNSSRNLSNFQGVRESIAKVVGKTRGKNLRLGFQPAESARMYYAVAVAGVFTAVMMRGFGIAPATRLFREHRPRRG
jgi:hypothetical protein